MSNQQQRKIRRKSPRKGGNFAGNSPVPDVSPDGVPWLEGRDPPDFNSCLESLKGGNIDAWGELYQGSFQILKRYLLKNFPDLNERDAEDIVSDTLIKVRFASTNYMGKSHRQALSWLFTITHNMAMDRFRSPVSKVIHITEKLAGLLEEDLSDPGEEDAPSVLNKWRAFFAALTSGERKVLELAALGKKPREIAKILELSEPRISQIRKAIAKKARENHLLDSVG